MVSPLLPVTIELKITLLSDATILIEATKTAIITNADHILLNAIPKV
jgi:hypothetical protein